VRLDEASFIQEVQFLPCQGLASQQELSLASCEVTTTTKRRQSDRQARTQVKQFSLVKCMEQRPTVFPIGKAPVGVGHGDCAGDAAGVGETGMPGDGWVEELGKPTEVSQRGE
jgi:hypothetical protein